MGRNKEGAEKKKGLAFPFEFHPEVEFDLLDARDYYDNQRQGLGDEFLLSVEASLNYISRHPLHFSILLSQTLHTRIKRLPFGIFYILLNDTIYITAVTHLNRNPQVWKSRM